MIKEEEGYVFRMIIDGRTKDFESKEALTSFLNENLRHPCCDLSIRSFHPTQNIIMEKGIVITR